MFWGENLKNVQLDLKFVYIIYISISLHEGFINCWPIWMQNFVYFECFASTTRMKLIVYFSKS